MKLSLNDIKSITLGTVKITENDGAFSFYRLTDAQLDYYERTTERYFIRGQQTASVLMDFTTDAENISFHYTVSGSAGKPFYFFDIYEDDMLIYHKGADVPDEDEGDVSVSFRRGMKRVRIYLPFSRKTILSDVTITDGAAMIAAERKLNALILGDSITQGSDGRYTSLSYANRMIERYKLNYINQGVGGEKFHAESLGDTKIIDPDFITLAMGVNDWATNPFDEIERDADGYFAKLTALYPSVPIIYISPIWINREGNDTTFLATVEMLESIATSYGAHVIHGLDLVPHEAEMLSDGVHPNDFGFSQYSERLFKKIDGLIELFKKNKEEKENGLTVL